MRVNHTTSIANGMASPAFVEHQGTYEDRLSFYRENQFTYIPMPFESMYYDREEKELKEIEDKQYVKIDATIRQVIDHLSGYPFLLIEDRHKIYRTEEGEIIAGIHDIPEGSEHLGDPREIFDELQEYKDEIVNTCKENNVYSIITLADVNRRTVKEALYPVVAELEARFTNVIKRSDNNPEDLYPDLSPETIGRWEKAKLSGLQMHISEHMKLSEMMKIIGKSEKLRGEFDYSSRNQFDSDLGGLVDLRNKIMHPSRTLVHERQDLDTLVNRITRAEEAIESHGGSVTKANYETPYYS